MLNISTNTNTTTDTDTDTDSDTDYRLMNAGKREMTKRKVWLRTNSVLTQYLIITSSVIPSVLTPY